MKKLNIFLASALALGFVACDDKSDLGVIQTNTQETLMTVDGITIAPATAYDASQISLANYQADDIIPMLTYSVDETIPAGADVAFDIEFGNENYANKIDVPLIAVPGVENTFGIKAADWDDAFRAIFGKTPESRNMYGRVAAYINIDKQISRLGTLDTWLGNANHAIAVTPVDLGINTEAEYYLYGSICSNVMADAVKMNHSALSQWDDTIWSLAFEVPASEANSFTWSVAPLSVKNSGNTEGLYGPVSDAELGDGTLVANGMSGIITGAGKYLLVVDMHNLTYSLNYAFDGIWTPGSGNGWGFGSGMLSSNDYTVYRGYAVMGPEFKLTPAASWDVAFGKATSGEITKDPKTGVISGPFDKKSGDNIGSSLITKGLYMAEVNVSKDTFSLTPISGIGIIGGFPDNNWSSDFVSLTPSEDLLTWTGEVTFTQDDIQWKFRMNGSWDLNLGGNGADGNTEFGDLVEGGGNLLPPGVGTYTVELQLTRSNVGDTYKVVLTKK